MIRIALGLLLGVIAGPAMAEDCPDFYRFVDFGLTDADGVIYRGGPLIRAENFDEDRLLLEDETHCLDVWPTLTDGRGNPIPVVSTIHFDPEAIGAPFTELAVRSTSDTNAAARQSGVAYAQRRDNPTSLLTQGETFLCVRTDLTPQIGCQLVSPYNADAPLIVNCHDGSCWMPVLAMDERVFLSARWDTTVDFMSEPEAAGEAMTQTVQAIYEFMSPLTASFQ